MATKRTTHAAKTPAKTTAQKAATKTQNMKWTKVQLPDGYTAIASGDFGEEWDYEGMPLLEGVVEGETREVEVGKGRDKRVSRVVNIKTANGTFALWESASLAAFFDRVYDGAEVAVAFQGYRDVGRPQPMKVFAAGIYGEEEPAAEPRTSSRKAAKTAKPRRR